MAVEQRLDELCAAITELKTMPSVYLRVREVVGDPQSSSASLAQVLASDAAMTTSVLKVANSALYGLPRRVEHMVQAISLLGMQTVHDMALVSALGATFSQWTVEQFDMSRFWRRGICAALAAKAMATSLGLRHAERHFVNGLLHEVGHIALGQAAPFEMTRVLEQSDIEDRQLPGTERDLFGFDYAMLGSHLLQKWNLPASIVQAIRFHTQPETATDLAIDAAIVHAAREIACAVVNEEAVSSRYSEVDLAVLRILCLDSDDFESIAVKVHEQEQETIAMLFPRFHNTGIGQARMLG